jgi:chromosome segregation ATPase
VAWWKIPLALIVAYLILSVGPWLVLWFVTLSMRRQGLTPEDEGKRLRALEEAQTREAGRLPALPRSGRFEPHDRAALQHRIELGAALSEANTHWLHVATWTPYAGPWSDALLMAAWRPMRETLAVWHYADSLRRTLDRAESAAQALRDEQEAARSIPAQVRGELGQLRAELSRLTTVVESEREAGTEGLDAFDVRLKDLGVLVEQGLDQLADTSGEQLPQVISKVDELLATLRPQVVEVDELVSRAAEERAQARAVIDRMHSALGLAQERWEVLKSRGNREPAVEQALVELGGMIDGPQQMLDLRTLDAYHQITEGVRLYDARFAEVMAQMDQLQDLMERSKAALEGNVQAVSEVQQQCDRLTRSDAALDPNISLEMVSQAMEGHREAEEQRRLGTRAGYERALELAGAAQQQLTEAHNTAAEFPERVRATRSLLAWLTPDTLDDLTARLRQVYDQMRAYPRHWNEQLNTNVQDASAAITQVQAVLAQLPREISGQQLFRQSELGAAEQALHAARVQFESAEDKVAVLKGEHSRILDLQEQFESALSEFTNQILPAAIDRGADMTPELQQRLERLHESVARGMVTFDDPEQVNYDQALNEWLPAAQLTLDEIISEHESNLAYYGGLVQDAVRRIDRAWERLTRLNPQATPGPTQDVEQLAAELDAWRVETERRAQSPLALRDAVRRSAALEQRLEALMREVADGRKTLDTVSRDWNRQAQAVEGLRSSINGLLTRSAWRNLVWNQELPDATWEQARDLESESRVAETFPEANNLLQQAIAAATQALELYRRQEDEIAGALSRLDDESAAVQNRLRRADRWAADLRAQGSEDLAEVERAMQRARNEIQAGQESDTFEEALRHVREAANALARVLGL